MNSERIELPFCGLRVRCFAIELRVHIHICGYIHFYGYIAPARFELTQQGSKPCMLDRYIKGLGWKYANRTHSNGITIHCAGPVH